MGAMNIFFVIKNRETGKKELITAPLTRGDILAGVTRDSILTLVRRGCSESVSSKMDGSSGAGLQAEKGIAELVDSVSERWFTMKDIVEAQRECRVRDVLYTHPHHPSKGHRHVNLDLHLHMQYVMHWFLFPL